MNTTNLFATALLLCAANALATQPASPTATPSATATPAVSATPTASASPAATPNFAITPDLSTLEPAPSATPAANPKSPKTPAKKALQKGKKEAQKSVPANSRVISLEKAYDMTLSCDQSIRKAYYEIRKANLEPWSALAKLGPSLYINGSYTNTRTTTHYNTVSTSISDRVTSRTDTRYGGIVYSQTLFDASVFPAYRYGKLSKKASRLTQRNTIRSMLYSLAQAYYNVLKEQKLVEVDQQTLELAGEQLTTAQAKFDAGTVARIDVLQAQASVEEARNSLIQAQGTLDTYRDTLSNILNLKGKTDFVLVEPPDETDAGIPFEESLKAALAKREDLQVSAIAVDQSKALKGEVLAEYYPTVNASASTEWNGYSGTGTDHNYAGTAVISVSVPVFTGGQREIDLLNANHNISEAQLDYESQWKTVEADVKTAWINVQTSREAIKALKAEETSYSQNYKDVQAKYQEGTATSLDVQQALRDLNNARTNLTNQVYDYQIYLRNLKRAEATFQNARVTKLRVR